MAYEKELPAAHVMQQCYDDNNLRSCVLNWPYTAE